MASTKPQAITTPPAKPPHEWSAEQKLAVVLEAAAVPPAELGAYLRRKGIHEAQLKEWREKSREMDVKVDVDIIQETVSRMTGIPLTRLESGEA